MTNQLRKQTFTTIQQRQTSENTLKKIPLQQIYIIRYLLG